MHPSGITQSVEKIERFIGEGHQPWDFLSSGPGSLKQIVIISRPEAMIFQRFRLDTIDETAAHKSEV